jgi:hypothetical protein
MTTDNKVGRPKWELSDDDFNQLIKMAEICCTQEEICGIYGICADTLDARLKERGFDNFSDFYKRHAGKGKMSLRRLQWQSAQDGSVPMQIWLGKNWLGQTDKVESEILELPPLQIITVNEADESAE